MTDQKDPKCKETYEKRVINKYNLKRLVNRVETGNISDVGD